MKKIVQYTKYLKLFLRLTLMTIMCSVLTPVMAMNSFLVAPGTVEVDMNRPQTQSFIVTNTGTDNVRISIKPQYKDFKDEASYLGGRDDPSLGKKINIMKNVRVSPRTLRLKPGQRRDVRISIRPPKNLEDGDYETGLLFAMKEVAYSNKMEKKEDDGAVSMGIRMKFETIVKVIGHKGEREPKISVACDYFQERPSFIVENNTVWRYEGWLTVYSDSSKKEEVHKERIIGPRQAKKAVLFNWKPEKGNAYFIETQTDDDVPLHVFSGECKF